MFESGAERAGARNAAARSETRQDLILRFGKDVADTGTSFVYADKDPKKDALTEVSRAIAREVVSETNEEMQYALPRGFEMVFAIMEHRVQAVMREHSQREFAYRRREAARRQGLI